MQAIRRFQKSVFFCLNSVDCCFGVNWGITGGRGRKQMNCFPKLKSRGDVVEERFEKMPCELLTQLVSFIKAHNFK